VTCSPSISGTVTTRAWSTPDGSPTSGSATSFTTSYSGVGSHSISLQACNDTACTTQRQTISVTAVAAAPTASPIPSQAPITVRGTITVTEQDIGCGFSAMPLTTGDITMTFSPGANPGDPISVTGTLNGSGAGSRSISCSGGTASEVWSASYRGSFSGTADARTGALTISGNASITQSATYSNCKDTSGNTAPCPAPPVSRTFPMTLNGNVVAAPGGATAVASGGLTIATGCSTAGTWRIGS
jgi:hypothetical protein